jgi:phosphate transport system protein
MPVLGGKTHSSSEYEKELGELRRLILDMGSKAEFMIAKGMRSLVEGNSSLANEVIESDDEVDAIEGEINDLCLRMLALRQPTASDLRFITTGMKIASDLERVADLAVNICERALELLQEPALKPYVELPRMAETTRGILKESLDSFLKEDTALARRAIAGDDAVDDMNQQLFRELLTYMMQDPKTIGRATRLTFISKYLERIADHATNVAEAVIFMVQGVQPKRGA